MSPPSELARTVLPVCLMLAIGWYGCTPEGRPLEPSSEPVAAVPTPTAAAPAREPEPPSSGPPTPTPTPPPKAAAPAELPRVASSDRFDVLAQDAPPPKAEDNAAVDWFLGTSSPNPSWSPDGTRIAHYDGRCISIRDAAGTLVDRLRTNMADAGCHGPRFSPTGKRVVASHPFHGPGVMFELGSGKATKIGGAPDGLWSLAFVDASTLVGRIHQVGTVLVDVRKPKRSTQVVSDALPSTTGYFPAFAPSGDRLARVIGEWTGTGELEILGLDRRRAGSTRVSDPWDTENTRAAVIGTRQMLLGGPIAELTWSADGRSLAAIRAPGWYRGYGDFDYGLGDLVVVDVESGSYAVRAHGVKNPSFSPDGRWIALEDADGVVVLDTRADAAPWPLDVAGSEPLWSPRGDAILTLDRATHQGVVLHLAR